MRPVQGQIRRIDYRDPLLLLRLNFAAARRVRILSPRYQNWTVTRTDDSVRPPPSSVLESRG